MSDDRKKYGLGFAPLVEAVKGQLGSTPDSRIYTRTGFSSLDRQIRGLQPSKLYVVGGRPGEGKTSLGTSIAANMLRLRTGPALYVTTELSEQEIIGQVVEAFAGGIPIYPNGRRSAQSEIDLLNRALSDLYPMLLHGDLGIIYRKSLDVETLYDRIEGYCDRALNGNRAVIIIDQANRIKRQDRDRHGYAIATEHLLNALEELAEKTDCPVVLLTQLSRAREQQSHPTMANIKHSGAFEEFAHCVLLLELSDGHGQKKEGSAYINYDARIHVAKNRSGPVGPVDFMFFGDAHTWREKERERDE